MRDDDGLTDTGAYLLVAGFGVAMVGVVSDARLAAAKGVGRAGARLVDISPGNKQDSERRRHFGQAANN
jgi:hypothetical protein